MPQDQIDALAEAWEGSLVSPRRAPGLMRRKRYGPSFHAPSDTPAASNAHLLELTPPAAFRTATAGVICETRAERRARRREKRPAAACRQMERREVNKAAHPQRGSHAAPPSAEEYWALRRDIAAQIKERARYHGSHCAPANTRVEAARPALHHEASSVRRHAISGKTAVKSLDAQLAQLMAELQYREITPEDYDLLLELDAQLKPKYVEKAVGVDANNGAAWRWIPLLAVPLTPFHFFFFILSLA